MNICQWFSVLNERVICDDFLVKNFSCISTPLLVKYFSFKEPKFFKLCPESFGIGTYEQVDNSYLVIFLHAVMSHFLNSALALNEWIAPWYRVIPIALIVHYPPHTGPFSFGVRGSNTTKFTE
jgi:hypothetical protein